MSMNNAALELALRQAMSRLTAAVVNRDAPNSLKLEGYTLAEITASILAGTAANATLFDGHTYADVLAAVNGGSESTLADLEAALAAFMARTDNPHAVTKAQVGLGNVDNFATASQADADAKAADKFATASIVDYMVQKAIDALVGAAPETLNTINEIAAALQNDPDIINNLMTEIGTKETPAGAQAKADQAEADAKAYTDAAIATIDSILVRANQAEAEAGTDAEKLMTPLTTAQAIAALGADLFLGKTAQAADSAKLEGKTLAEVIADAQAGVDLSQVVLKSDDFGQYSVGGELLSALIAALQAADTTNATDLGTLQTAFNTFVAAKASAAEVIAGTDDVKYTTSLSVAAAIQSAIDDLVGAAPEALNTINELAAALNNDPDIINQLMSQIGTKLSVTTDLGANPVMLSTEEGQTVEGTWYEILPDSTGAFARSTDGVVEIDQVGDGSWEVIDPATIPGTSGELFREFLAEQTFSAGVTYYIGMTTRQVPAPARTLRVILESILGDLTGIEAALASKASQTEVDAIQAELDTKAATSYVDGLTSGLDSKFTTITEAQDARIDSLEAAIGEGSNFLEAGVSDLGANPVAVVSDVVSYSADTVNNGAQYEVVTNAGVLTVQVDPELDGTFTAPAEALDQEILDGLAAALAAVSATDGVTYYVTASTTPKTLKQHLEGLEVDVQGLDDRITGEVAALSSALSTTQSNLQAADQANADAIAALTTTVSDNAAAADGRLDALEGAQANTQTKDGSLDANTVEVDVEGTPTQVLLKNVLAQLQAHIDAVESGSSTDLTALQDAFNAFVAAKATGAEVIAGTDDAKYTTSLAVKTAIDAAIADLVGTAPEALNTINELAAALNNDPDIINNLMTQIGNKLDATATAADSAKLGGVDAADYATKTYVDDTVEILTEGFIASALEISSLYDGDLTIADLGGGSYGFNGVSGSVTAGGLTVQELKWDGAQVTLKVAGDQTAAGIDGLMINGEVLNDLVSTVYASSSTTIVFTKDKTLPTTGTVPVLF